MTVFEFSAFLDTTELAKLSRDAVEVTQNLDDYDAQEVQEAQQVIQTITAAQRSINLYGIDSYDAMSLEYNWSLISREYNGTLVRSDEVAEFMEEKVVDYGVLNERGLDLIGRFIDWEAYAESQEHIKVTFPNPNAREGELIYWMFD